MKWTFLIFQEKLPHLRKIRQTLVNEHKHDIERFYQTYNKLREKYQCNDYMVQMMKTSYD